MDLGAGDIQFQEDEQYVPRRQGVERAEMSQWLVDKGIAENIQQATYILLGVAVTATIIALTIPFVFDNSGPKVSESFLEATMQSKHPAP